MSLRPDIPDQFVTLPNGLKVRYMEKGSGFPLLCVHGLGVTMGADQWISNFDAFAKVAHVYSIDVPGWGWSDLPDKGYSFDMWSDTLAQFCRAVGIQQTDVVGHSLGGWISIYFAHQHPEIVRRLILGVNAGLNPPVGTLTGGAYKLPDRQRVRGIHENLWRGNVEVTEEMVDELMKRLERPGRAKAYDAIRSYVGLPETREKFSPRRLLPELKMPVLYAWGDDADPLLLEFGLEEFRLTPHARLAVIYRGGEMPQGYRPREFEAAVIPFITDKVIEPLPKVGRTGDR